MVANSSHFIVSHDSIGFSWVTPQLESLGSHVVTFRAAGLHGCTPHSSTRPPPCRAACTSPGSSEEGGLPESQGIVLHLCCWKQPHARIQGRNRDPLLDGKPAHTPSRGGIVGLALKASHHISFANYGAPPLWSSTALLHGSTW